MTLSTMASTWAGPEPAIVTDETEWSRTELLERTAGAADALEALLADPRSPTPVLFAAAPGAYAWVLGGAAARRPIAPLGTRLSVRELVACVRALGSPVLLADHANEALAADVVAGAGTTRTRLVVVDAPDRALPTAPPPPNPRPLPGPDDIAFVVHTSGTSGVPKAVPYRQDRAGHRARLLDRLYQFHPGAVYATSSSFHHVGGFAGAISALATGLTIVPVERFSLDGWRQLADLGVTHALLVPTMIDMLLEAGTLATPSLRLLTYGASPMHPLTLAATLDTLPDVDLVQIFGQTEGTPLTVLTSADHRTALQRPELLTSVGRAVDGVELRVDEPDERGIGEVWVRGAHLALSSDRDGWLHTGDLGSLDREGFLRLAGRTGDRIVRGGENVDPLEVEHVLATHAGVREVAVRGVADQRWGQKVAAWVVPADPADPPRVEDLRHHARASLAGFKVPTAWAMVDELPRNAAGKLLRRELDVDELGG
jgi:acyl-CoA synthetase (AMP-forming)/AMP-acid ligase II